MSVGGGEVSSVGELGQLLGLAPPVAGLWVGGQWQPADRTLESAGVAEGIRVGIRPGPAPDKPGWTLEVVGGLCAGDRFPVPADGLSLGRSPTADATLAGVGLRPRHARLECRDGRVFTHTGVGGPAEVEVEVEAAAPLRLGGALVQVSKAPDDCPSRLVTNSGEAAAGKVAFNRPPRPPAPGPPRALQAPGQEPTRAPRSFAFGWAALAGPLLAGGLMAVLYSPYMALFALLSPIMMGANWIDSRRRDRGERRRSQRRVQASLVDFHVAAGAARAAEVRRRRDVHPHVAEAVRRVRQPSVRLWERRPDHDDFMSLVAAHGSVPFEPELAVDNGSGTGPGNGPPAEEVAALLDQLGPMADSPIAVDLKPGKLLGLVGPRAATTAIARALLVQAAAFHGPADLAVLVAADEVTASLWTWTAWLPHAALAHLPGGGPRLRRSAVAETATELAGAWSRRGQAHWPQLLVLADGEDLATGRTPPLRPLLNGSAGPVSAIVLAASADQLPAATTAVIEARDLSGTVDLSQSELFRPELAQPTLSQSELAQPERAQAGGAYRSVLATGMSLDLARATARGLARFEDPEQAGADSGVPDRCSLFDLLNLPAASPIAGSLSPPAPVPPDPVPPNPAPPDTGAPIPEPTPLAEAVAARWQKHEQSDHLGAPIGADRHGPLLADLARDGPHALVGGTTGSGKSEMLRTLVASVAATYSPRQVNFVLVDYKGGSAFDACASLPHVVGLVTDLDDRLAERALRCLEAELRHREKVLRAWGASDLAHYRSLTRPEEPMPEPPPSPADAPTPEPPLARLVVIIDEFAALATELPGFMDALVNVAQRGRSLGMHLVLATQRPAGTVSANIRTNSALRIALRVLDAADSVDVLDSPEAAAIGRHRPGRAFARFGPSELVEFQCALVTGVTAARREPRVVPAPDGIPIAEPALANGAAQGDEAPDDLSRLVAAAHTAWATAGGAPPRQPWPDPLPPVVSLDELPRGPDGTTGVAFALADDPDRQRQHPLCWEPEDGNALFAGNLGSGTTTALASVAVALARRHRPEQCHLYVVESGTGQLLALEGLPHCGAVVGPDQRDRIRRLIRRLEDELDRRLGQGRGSPDADTPLVVTLVDNWGALAKSLDDVTDHALLTSLERVWAEGPAVGMNLVAAADQLSRVSRSIGAATAQTFVFRLSDPAQYRQWGVTVEDPAALPPGRGFAIPSGLELQVGLPDGGLAEAVAAIAASCSQHGGHRHDNQPQGGPLPVESLPAVVDPSRLGGAVLHRGDLKRGDLNGANLGGASRDSSPVYVPLGLNDDSLSPVGLTLYPAEHALVLGPPRSGRTAALALVAQMVAAGGGRVMALASGRSPLSSSPHIDIAAQSLGDLTARGDLLAAASEAEPTTFVLIDDAEAVADPDGDLKRLATDSGAGLHIVAASRADRLRTAYGHWTAEIRFSRTGVLLQPTPLDGDLFNVLLPTRPTLPSIPGRGYLIQNGTPSIIQIATTSTNK